MAPILKELGNNTVKGHNNIVDMLDVNGQDIRANNIFFMWVFFCMTDCHVWYIFFLLSFFGFFVGGENE